MIRFSTLLRGALLGTAGLLMACSASPIPHPVGPDGAATRRVEPDTHDRFVDDMAGPNLEPDVVWGKTPDGGDGGASIKDGGELTSDIECGPAADAATGADAPCGPEKAKN